jgi:D-2-hydroxyacid dehydrogenase (NADP+)
MRIRNVLVGASDHAAYVEGIRKARPDLEYRGNATAALQTEDLEWADVYVGFRRPPLPSLGNIRWVHCTGAGVDAWLYPTEIPRDVLLTRTSESFGPMIAEWALARALAFTQHLLELADHQREHRWVQRDPMMLCGSTAVVVGTGDVGTHIAKVFRALGCRVRGVSRSGKGDTRVFETVHPVAELALAVDAATWLVLAIPLTAETDGLVSRDVLSRCKGTVLINAGRGAVVQESAIPEALDNGWLRGAALDVFEVEPLPTESPLWDDRRIMISPHISGPTTVEGAVTGFLECLTDVEQGVQPKWTVDRARQY